MLAHKLLSAHLSVEIFLLKIYTYVIYEELHDTGRYFNFSHQGLRGGALQASQARLSSILLADPLNKKVKKIPVSAFYSQS